MVNMNSKDTIQLSFLAGVATCIVIIVTMLHLIDTKEVEPSDSGKWIAQDAGRTRFQCSVCMAQNYESHFRYCPNCGVEMEE